MMSLPCMARVQQRFDRPRLDDVDGAVREQMARILPAADLSGKRIAVTAGSRGIANIAVILRAVVAALREAGAEPFLVPAMGSHGGATAEGQVSVLAGFGITEDFCGAPILSSMDVETLGHTSGGMPVYLDRNAFGADGIVLVNRIKAHTDFQGDVESGLCKMAVLGLGKQAQALALHRLGIRGIRDVMREVAREVLGSGRIICGLGILENAYDETAHVEALRPEEIEARESELLLRSKTMMPRLPVEDIDLLIVDEMGKNFSGTGMDTNIIGRRRIPGEPEPNSPRVKYLFVRGLSKATYGNATGIGLADLTTRRLLDHLSFEATNANVETSTFIARAMIPIVFGSDQEALHGALRACWGVEPGEARIVHIPNTLELEHVSLSESLLEEVRGRDDLEVLGPPASLRFDAAGNLSA